MHFDKAIASCFVALYLILSPQSMAATSYLKVMTYNAENLFDTKHDEGKNDYSYLPLKLKQSSPEIQAYCRSLRSSYYRKNCLNSDWSEGTLRNKIRNLSKVIKLVSPDILVLEEVENINVLKQLRDQGLSNQGYREVILIEGPDSRGIDVGILSRFPLAEPAKLHYVDLSNVQPRQDKGKKVKETRGVLEATFEVNGAKVRIFGNHWPSQANPDQARVQAARVLYEMAIDSPYPVIATGDFNTLESDRPHGINEYILNEGRSHSFWDSEKVHFGEQSEFKKAHRGTHHFNGKWSSLDRVFVLKESLSNGCKTWWRDCVTPVWSKFKIVKEDFMLTNVTITDDTTGEETTYRGVPARFDRKTGEGFSDHLPVVMTFKISQ